MRYAKKDTDDKLKPLVRSAASYDGSTGSNWGAEECWSSVGGTSRDSVILCSPQRPAQHEYTVYLAATWTFQNPDAECDKANKAHMQLSSQQGNRITSYR